MGHKRVGQPRMCQLMTRGKYFLLIPVCIFLLGYCAGDVCSETDSTIKSFEIYTEDDVERFRLCTKVTKELAIETKSLENLKGLENLEYVKKLVISGNQKLKNFKGLKNLKKVKDFYIYYNPRLKSFEGLETLRTIENMVDVLGNDNITSFRGLDVNWIPQLRIIGNDSLLDLQGLSSTESIDIFSVVNNKNLKSLTGLDMLKEVIIVSVAHNENLETISSLSGITKISQLIDIYGNDNLTQFPNLNNISYQNFAIQVIDNASLNYLFLPAKLTKLYDLEIDGNPSLLDLGGFQNLEILSGDLILKNSVVFSLTGLDNLNSIEGDLVIENNPNLTSAIVTQFVEGLGNNIGGETIVKNNGN